MKVDIYTATDDAAVGDFDRMKGTVAGWVDMRDPQWQRFVSIFRQRTLEAQEHLLQAGSSDHVIAFVSEGLLRLYYANRDGKESIKAFATEGRFAGSVVSSMLGLPSRYGIQALEPTRLLVADYDEFGRLYDEHPVFDRLGRRLMEQSLQRKELRERSFLEQSARERYEDFVERHPDLLQRVPLYHIASYLGITEVTLSRLRRELVS